MSRLATSSSNCSRYTEDVRNLALKALVKPKRKPTRRNAPPKITEDEADGIISQRRLSEPSIPFEKVLKKHGFILDRQDGKVRVTRTGGAGRQR
jgi:hypothetical protein